MSLTLNPLPNSQALRQARALVGDLTPRQRYGIGGGVLAVVAAMLLFVHFMAKPGYSLLYASLEPADAQQVASQLSGLAIPYELAPDGTSISVPADQLDRARLQMAARGLPHSGQLGFEIFDKTNWSGSDFAEQVNYQRALEGELERTIETIHGVQAARVHVTLAHDSLFTEDERGAKAAVLLTLRDGTLDPNMANAIQHLVASAVDHLSPANVAILDASGQMSLAAAGGIPGVGGAGLGNVVGEDRLENSLSAKILATLAPVVGAQHVRANVSVEYDPSTDDNTQETYDPSASALLSSQRSSAGSSPDANVGVPGTTSNLPAAQAAGTNFNAQLGTGSPQGQSSDSQTFAVSRTLNHVVKPAGTIQRLTAAVVVDDAVQTVTQNGHTTVVRHKRSADELQQIQSLAAAAIGINPSRGDVLTVSNLAFVAPPLQAEPTPVAPPSLTDRLPTLLRWAALAAVLLCLLLACEFLLWRPTRRRKLAVLAQAAQLAAATAASSAPASAPAAASAQNLVPAPPAAALTEDKSNFLNMTELLRADPDDTPPTVQRVLHLKDRLAERVKREPAVASRLVQGWMNNKRREDTA